VLSLPRRTWTDAEAERFADELTALLRTPTGTMRLRPIQAIALIELAQCNGLFAPIRVGGGKTLVSALAPTVVGSTRPLLMLPGKLAEKTRREFDHLRLHWQMPDLYRVMSYELVGQPQSGVVLDTDGRVITPDVITRYQPDLIFADECHRLRYHDRSVTRRTRRYLKTYPSCILACSSGTITTASVLDYWYLLTRALGRGAPLPIGRSLAEDWAQALDGDEQAVELGALTMLGGHDLHTTRLAYRDRLVQTPGVVVFDRPFRDVPLSIDPLPLEAPPVVVEALEGLRDRWELPDGSPLVESLELWRHTRELALGFYTRWDPPAPREWLDARAEWSAQCRHILTTNRRQLDSPEHVADAVRAGHYPEATDALAAWVAIRDTFEPNPVPVWLHPFAVEAAAAWLEADGIVWCEHEPIGTRIAELAGTTYFAAGARDRFGVYIEDARGPIVASMNSCNEGINLQHKWSRNLITSPPSNSKQIEQIIGRTHREGQRGAVSVEWLRTCDEHQDAYDRSLNLARYVEATTGQTQKVIQ
jgi:hypothetical protein